MKKLLFFLFLPGTLQAQCTSCTTSSAGCTVIVNSLSSAAVTVNGSTHDVLCIDGPNAYYQGAATIDGGTVIALNGGTFAPSSLTFSSADQTGGEIEIKSGSTGSLKAFSCSKAKPLIINNCGTLSMQTTTLGGSAGNQLNNNGFLDMSAYDLNMNNTGSVCNGAAATFYVNNLNYNGVPATGLHNYGKIIINQALSFINSAMLIESGSILITYHGLSLVTGIINANGTCASVRSYGTSICQQCTLNGYGDFYDNDATQPPANPFFNNIISSYSISNFDNKFDCAILPIKLLSFAGKVLNSEAHLSWNTGSEDNNDYFTVEKLQGNDFIPIGKVDGAGNSDKELRYNFNAGIISSPTYYRISQTDYNGKTISSEPIKLMPADAHCVLKYITLLGQDVTLNQISGPYIECKRFDDGTILYTKKIKL